MQCEKWFRLRFRSQITMMIRDESRQFERGSASNFVMWRGGF